MNENQWAEAVVRNRQPLDPTPTGIAPRLQTLPEIQAVIFDVYGTLVVSASGDVGTDSGATKNDVLSAAYEAVGWGEASETLPTVEMLHEQIRATNTASAGSGTKPEVDIVDIWRQVLRSSGREDLASETASVVKLAAEYESRANPTWPMPGASQLLRSLYERQFAMGIVSNAQFFTPPLVRDLVGGPLAEHGLDLDLCIFSYRFREAKPSPRLFEALTDGLRRHGIDPASTLYIGNDMLNDIWAASQAGLRTAWFAGDARSCRERKDDDRCRELSPDLVLTDLLQVLECLGERHQVRASPESRESAAQRHR